MKPDSQFVTLGLEQELFAVPVETVVEILDYCPVYRVPDSPAYLLGLIDVRGRSVPVIDLRTKLGLPTKPPMATTRILVLEVPLADRVLVLGLVADRVLEVAALGMAGIAPPPDIGVAWRSAYIAGVGRRGDSFVVILNLTHLFSTEEAAFIGRDTAALPSGAG